MEDRKRDGDIAKYENVLALLRNPKAEFKLGDLPDAIKKDAYSNLLITDINGMLVDLDEVQRDINRKEGNLARMEAEEMQHTISDAMDRATNPISRITERKANKGFYASTEEIGIADMDIVDKDFTTLGSIGQNRRRRRERMAREAINAGIQESKNERY